MTDRELDALVAEKVFDGRYLESDPWEKWDEPPSRRWCCYLPNQHGVLWNPTGDWSPSTSIADAWEVVEKLTFDHPFKLNDQHMMDDSIHWYAEFDPCTSELVHGEADTAPRAICLAALRAVGVEVES